MFARLLPFAVVACAFTCSSCGNSSGLYPVTGTVLCNGEPAVGATITFIKKDAIGDMSQTSQGGVVGEDGTFTLASPKGEGAAPGEYIVLVEWKEGAGKGHNAALGAPDRLKKRYLNAAKPLLTASVDAKANNLPPFELELK
jgi:hypothetical protein